MLAVRVMLMVLNHEKDYLLIKSPLSSILPSSINYFIEEKLRFKSELNPDTNITQIKLTFQMTQVVCSFWWNLSDYQTSLVEASHDMLMLHIRANRHKILRFSLNLFMKVQEHNIWHLQCTVSSIKYVVHCLLNPSPEFEIDNIDFWEAGIIGVTRKEIQKNLWEQNIKTTITNLTHT